MHDPSLDRYRLRHPHIPERHAIAETQCLEAHTLRSRFGRVCSLHIYAFTLAQQMQPDGTGSRQLQPAAANCNRTWLLKCQVALPASQ
eukprot:scaffold1277_cov253-Pinguiococcus_pyrenoidosus.AAC.10